MVDVIGILSGVITIATFFQDLAPDPDRYKHRIRVGQRSEDSGGWFPQAIFSNAYNEELARSSWQSKWVENGEFMEESFGNNRRQVDNIEVLAGNNAVCFVWHEFYDSDGSDPIVVFGETAKQCGAPWYPSDIRANIGGRDEYRDCAWLNQCNNDPGGGCRDDAWSGYNLYDLRYWNNVKSGSADPNDVCNQILIYRPERKRALAETGSRLANDVIYTERPLANVICQSQTSVGQSLVSTTQELFCDMHDKQMYPLCRTDMREACFDVSSNELRQTLYSNPTGSPAGMRQTSSGRPAVTTFHVSEVRLDADARPSMERRQTATERFVLNGSTYYYSANTTQCDDCCLSVVDPLSQYNETHYFGPIVDEPVTYDRIANGIIINSSSNNSSIILDCPAGYSVRNIYRGAENVNGAGPFASRLGLASVVSLGVAISSLSWL